MKLTATVGEVKDWLIKNAQDGVKCPCCSQFVKIYKRKLNSNMCVFLVSLVRLWEQEGRQIRHDECRYKGRDYNFLTFWNLAKTSKAQDPKKSMSGLWAPTQDGIDFVYRNVDVPSHVFLYNNKVLRFSGTRTTIEEALGSKFDYAELMRS